jgi:hypothetical protein
VLAASRNAKRIKSARTTTPTINHRNVQNVAATRTPSMCTSVVETS